MTGTNAINYFAPSIFASVGLTRTSTSLLATGVYGIVNVCTTLVYVFFIVDNVGRRKPLITGALIQACCLLYLTVFVKLSTVQTGQITAGGYVGVVSVYIYAFGWSFGWSVIPWVVPSEIFPNRIRAYVINLHIPMVAQLRYHSKYTLYDAQLEYMGSLSHLRSLHIRERYLDVLFFPRAKGAVD
jgi:hypothetical protein